MGWEPTQEQKAFLDRLIEEKVRTQKEYDRVVDFLERLSQPTEDQTAPYAFFVRELVRKRRLHLGSGSDDWYPHFGVCE